MADGLAVPFKAIELLPVCSDGEAVTFDVEWEDGSDKYRGACKTFRFD